MTNADIHKLVLRDETADGCNRRLAIAIRKVEALHEASFHPGVKREDYNPAIHQSEWAQYSRYLKSYSDCTREVVGDDPIATILDCLFTAGYADIFDFCDKVLGPEPG